MGSCHTVLSKGAGLVTQQILNASKFFGKSARPYDSVWNFWVVFDLVSIHRLAHVEIHSKTESPLGVIMGSYIGITHLIGIIDEKRMRNRKT